MLVLMGFVVVQSGEVDAGPVWMSVPEFFACLIGLGPRLAV